MQVFKGNVTMQKERIITEHCKFSYFTFTLSDHVGADAHVLPGVGLARVCDHQLPSADLRSREEESEGKIVLKKKNQPNKQTQQNYHMRDTESGDAAGNGSLQLLRKISGHQKAFTRSKAHYGSHSIMH